MTTEINRKHRGTSPHSADVNPGRVVAIGSDDAGFDLKRVIAGLLGEQGYEVRDYGCDSAEPVDYPDVAYAVARAVARGEHDRAILICGTGIGMAIAANKVPGVRAAQVQDAYSAERARKSNDAQIMTLGSRVVGPELAKSLVLIWLASEFAGGASARKVAKIMEGEGLEEAAALPADTSPGVPASRVACSRRASQHPR